MPENKIDRALASVLNSHKDYMNKVEDLFQVIGNEEDCFRAARKGLPKIKEINDMVRETDLFKENEKKFNSYVEQIKKDNPEKIDRVKTAWTLFLEKSVLAPTRFHLIGVVVLCIPAVWEMLLEYQTEEGE